MDDLRKIKLLLRTHLNNLQVSSGADTDERIMNDALAVMEQSKKARPASAGLNVRRMIMKSPITKLAAAAAIIIAVLIGLTQFGGSGVVWAEVAKKVDQAPTYVCRLNFAASTPGQETVELTAKKYVSSEHGQREDTYFKDGELYKYTYFIPEEKVEIDLMPAEKKYRRKPLTEKELEVRQVEDVRGVIKELLSGKHKKLGRDSIDGIEAEGIEIDDPNLIKYTSSFEVESMGVQLWVDTETYLPVLLKAEMRGSKGEKAMLKADNFQWNVQLEPSIFEPNIPDDYTLED